MPANVFAAQQQFAMAVHEQGRMHGAAVLTQRLEGVDALAQADQPLRGRQRGARQLGQVRQRLLQGFDAAQATAAGAGQLAALVLQVPESAAGDFQVRIHRRATSRQFDVVDFGGAFNDAAAHTKTNGKIFQVGRADEHDGLVQAVVHDRQGDFFGQWRAARLAIAELDVIIGSAGGGQG